MECPHYADPDYCVLCIFGDELRGLTRQRCVFCSADTWHYIGQCLRCIGDHQGSHSDTRTRALILSL